MKLKTCKQILIISYKLLLKKQKLTEVEFTDKRNHSDKNITIL